MTEEWDVQGRKHTMTTRPNIIQQKSIQENLMEVNKCKDLTELRSIYESPSILIDLAIIVTQTDQQTDK